MSDKKANGSESGSIEIDGERYATHSFDLDGTRYTVRELSVDEGDDAAEAATEDGGKFNSRLNTRLVIAKSIVEPVTSVEAVGKFGARKFGTILRHFNNLNATPAEVPTPPAG